MITQSRLNAIVTELRDHLADPDATLNDSEVDRLYREWHNIRDDRETDLEEVEQWARYRASVPSKS